MVNVPALLHTLCKAQNPKTRIRVYFIDDTVDCWDDADVEANGTLLKYNVSDTDSNGRINISQSPVIFTEYYNPNTNIEIGRCASNTMQLTFINDDGALNAFDFGRCKVYIDLYDDTNEEWLPCPMGVYIIDTPVRRLVSNISVTAYDQMRLLEADAFDWWNTIDFTVEGGVDSWTIFTSLCTHLGIHFASSVTASVMCQMFTYTAQPFAGSNMTYRDFLEALTEANGCSAVFDRDGSLLLIPLFNDATDYGYANADGYFDFDQAEYSVSAVTGVSIKSENDDIGVEAGDGNMYIVSQNIFLNSLPTKDENNETTTLYIQSACNALLVRFTDAFSSYTPVSFRTIGDWSLCAGDRITVTFKGATLVIPIMQQTLKWDGSSVETTVTASGDKEYPKVPNRVVRQELTMANLVHKLEVTAASLLSRIQEGETNYTEISQSVETIAATVAWMNGSLTHELSENGAIWQFMSQTQEQVNNLSTYIRFTSEPAIIIGTDDYGQLKLKLLNNVIYFFQGNDDVPVSEAFAQYSSENTIVNSIISETSIQCGNEDSGNWVWHILDDGSFALDLI